MPKSTKGSKRHDLSRQLHACLSLLPLNTKLFYPSSPITTASRKDTSPSQSEGIKTQGTLCSILYFPTLGISNSSGASLICDLLAKLASFLGKQVNIALWSLNNCQKPTKAKDNFSPVVNKDF